MFLAMWVFMLVCNLIAPSVMILFGQRFLKNPPRERSCLYGYRTNRSMKNQDTWDFAQEYMGQLWWKAGWIMGCSVAAVECVILLTPTTELVVWWSFGVTLLELVVMPIVTFVPVERALKKTFDKDGNRR